MRNQAERGEEYKEPFGDYLLRCQKEEKLMQKEQELKRIEEELKWKEQELMRKEQGRNLTQLQTYFDFMFQPGKTLKQTLATGGFIYIDSII